jgi:hypothetical protein
MSLIVFDSLIWFSQELNGAVTKINELIRQRNMGGQPANQFVLDQDDIQALGFGTHLTQIFAHYSFFVNDESGFVSKHRLPVRSVC